VGLGQLEQSYPKKSCLYVEYVLLAWLPQWERKYLATQRLEMPGYWEHPGAPTCSWEKRSVIGEGLCGWGCDQEGDGKEISKKIKLKNKDKQKIMIISFSFLFFSKFSHLSHLYFFKSIASIFY